MAFYVLKILLTAFLIASVSEIAKRSSFFAALVTSLPLISIFALTWIYIESRDIEKISKMTREILLLVLPSLTFFIALPPMLKAGWNFYLSMIISIALTAVVYWLMISVMPHLGIKLQ